MTKKSTSHRTKRMVILILTALLSALSGPPLFEAASDAAAAVAVG